MTFDDMTGKAFHTKNSVKLVLEGERVQSPAMVSMVRSMSRYGEVKTKSVVLFSSEA
jgi:hypothetical protein